MKDLEKYVFLSLRNLESYGPYGISFLCRIEEIHSCRKKEYQNLSDLS